MATYTILGGKVRVYKRHNSRFWQCSTYLAGRNRRVSTKQESLQLAKEFAEDWYLTLCDKNRQGELLAEKTFKQAADQFERKYEIITDGLPQTFRLSQFCCRLIILFSSLENGYLRNPGSVETSAPALVRAGRRLICRKTTW